MPERMRRILGGLSEAMRVEYDLNYHWSYPPTVNDKAVNDVVRDVGRAVVGAENVVEHDIIMWAEDMSFMQEQRPAPTSWWAPGVTSRPVSRTTTRALPSTNGRWKSAIV